MIFFVLLAQNLGNIGLEALQVTQTGAAGYMMDAGIIYYAGVAAASCHYAWQLTDVNLDSRQDCLAKFVSNKWFGALVFSGIVADKLLIQGPLVTELC